MYVFKKIYLESEVIVMKTRNRGMIKESQVQKGMKNNCELRDN